MGKQVKKAATFEHSSELKRAFNELSEKWCRKHRLAMADLAERCGVSLQYLSHIGRYGRIPSKPILTLLAFNLELPDPAELFRMAGLADPWAYEPGIGLRGQSAAESGLLSINLDMNGFASVIRDIVRSEVQPKRIEELLGRRPLRVGLNRGQFFLFEDAKGGGAEGFFPEFMRSLALSLHCEVEFIDIRHGDFHEMLADGEIDCFGPIYRSVPRLAQALFTKPFCSVPLAGLGRTKAAPAIGELPAPRRLADIRKKEYIIAVHRDSMAHHFAITGLGVPESRVLACDLPEEALERILLTKIPRPAHLLLTDSPYASKCRQEHGNATTLLFQDNRVDIPSFEDTIAVRADWPPLLALLDQALELLRRGGATKRLFEKSAGDHAETVSVL